MFGPVLLTLCYSHGSILLYPLVFTGHQKQTMVYYYNLHSDGCLDIWSFLYKNHPYLLYLIMYVLCGLLCVFVRVKHNFILLLHQTELNLCQLFLSFTYSSVNGMWRWAFPGRSFSLRHSKQSVIVSLTGVCPDYCLWNRFIHDSRGFRWSWVVYVKDGHENMTLTL